MRYYNNENFEDLVKEGVHLVDFYADWCGPCKMLGTVLEEVSDKIDIIKVNTDNFGDLANRFKVMSIPHLVFFKDGKEVSYSVGFMDKDMLLEKIEEVNKL